MKEYWIILSVVWILVVGHSNGFIWKLSITEKFRKFKVYVNDKERMKEEQFRIQQEILARRKNKSQMKVYFNKVEERRKDASKEVKMMDWKSGEEDPLNRWKEAEKKGKIKPLGYEPEPNKTDSKFGLNVIIPLNPIGIPKYDNGERFDLRLPYAERGYVDPDADVVSKLINGFKGIFKKRPESPSKEGEPSKAPKK